MNKFWIAGLGLVVAGIAWYAYASLGSPNSAKGDDKSGRPTGVEPAQTPTQAGAPSKGPENSAGMAAIRRASETGAHLFIFVHQGNSTETRENRDKFESAISKIGESVQWTVVDRDNPSEREIVAKYDLRTSPMPLILAVAPNGAITAGFPAQRLTEEKLRDAVASPVLQNCLKALQERRMVFLCVRGKSIRADDPSWQGVNEFKADGRFDRSTEIVQVDPADPAEKKFLKMFEISPDTSTPTTVFLAPPGNIIAKIAGPTNKEDLVRVLASSGCGQGGCAPTG